MDLGGHLGVVGGRIEWPEPDDRRRTVLNNAQGQALLVRALLGYSYAHQDERGIESFTA
jgi:hypothetical protein